MKIRIACVGKMKESYFLKAQEEYIKRLSRFAAVEVLELADERTPAFPTEREREAVLKKEGERIKRAMAGFDVASVLRSRWIPRPLPKGWEKRRRRAKACAMLLGVPLAFLRK